MDLCKKPFNEIDLNDDFFNSLRDSYPDFDDWFRRKAASWVIGTWVIGTGTLIHSFINNR